MISAPPPRNGPFPPRKKMQMVPKPCSLAAVWGCARLKTGLVWGRLADVGASEWVLGDAIYNRIGVSRVFGALVAGRAGGQCGALGTAARTARAGTGAAPSVKRV